MFSPRQEYLTKESSLSNNLMGDYARLFDVIHQKAKETPSKIAYADKHGRKTGEAWREYSFQETLDMMNSVSIGLLNQGIEKNDKVALISNSRCEWNFADYGVQQIGAVLVPVYPTISEAEFKFIFEDAEIKLCLVENAEIYEKVAPLLEQIPLLKAIFTFDEVEGATSWNDILQTPTEEEQERINLLCSEIDAEELATIIYTSGTTGNPKGVMLSHRNISSNIIGISKVLPIMSGSKALSFLPLCHIFERTISYTYLANDVSIYYAENLETIGENLKELGPEYFTTVPRLLEKVYEKIMEKGKSLSGIKKMLFHWSLNLGARFELNKNQGPIYNVQLAIVRKLVFSKWHEALGGNIKGIVTGAAAFQPKLAKIFGAAGVPIVEGYGLTETSPVLTSNRLDIKQRRIGTVGPPLPGVEIKIANDGEILAKGPNIMMGYYNRQDLTDEVIDKDGWFHTGDIGEFVEGEFLKITDRKKELFKTSGGKYVSPQQVENKYKESPFIEQIMVVGNNRKFVSALIVPSILYLGDYCKHKSWEFENLEAMVRDERVKEKIQKEIEAINPEINHVEQVKRFTLLAREWTAGDGELTPTTKLKRRVIEEKFAEEIENMYE